MSLLENSLDLILENNNIKNSKFIEYLVDNIQYRRTEKERKENIENIEIRSKIIVLKLCDILIKNNALLAGGSVLGAFSNFKIKDLDIYVNEKDAMNIYKELVTLGYNKVDEQCIAPAYDQSFFRKNHILSRFRFDHETFIPIDLMIIHKDIKLTDVVTNFDLSFCEIWFDGQNVYAVDPEGIKNKTGMLKPEYSEALFKYFNKFISNRIKKYSYRGFKIFYSNSERCSFIYNHSEIKTISDPNGTVKLVDEEDDMNVYPEEWAVKKVLSTFYKMNCNKEFDLYYYFTLNQFTYKDLFEMLKKYYHISSQSYGTYSYISSDLQSIPFPREYNWTNPENPRYPEDASPKFKKRRVDLKVKLIIKYLIFSTFGKQYEDYDKDEKKNGIWKKSKKSEKWRTYLNDVLNADIKNEEAIINGENFYVDFFDYSDNSLSAGRNQLLTDIIFIENLLEPRESTRKTTLETDDEGYVEGGDNITFYKDYINLEEFEIKDTINEYYRIVNQRSSISYYRHNYLIPKDFEILDDGFSEVTMNDWLDENSTNIIFLYDSDQTDSINGIKGLGLTKDALYQLYSNLIVECKESYDSNVSITKEKVFFDKIYYKSSVGDSYNNGILLSKLNCVKDEIEKENRNRIFYLTGKKLLKTIASLSNVYVYPNLNIYGSIIDTISGTHCGEGQQSYVYDEIYIINKDKLASREKFNEIMEKNLIPHDPEYKTDPCDNILTKTSDFLFNILKNGSGKKPFVTGLMEAIRDVRDGNDALYIINRADVDYLNRQDDEGNTALIYAAELGDLSIVEKLLEKKVDITLQDKRGDTALKIARENGFEDIVRLLLGGEVSSENEEEEDSEEENSEYEVDIEYEEYVIKYLLNKAIREGDISAVSRIAFIPDIRINSPDDKSGDIPLILAAKLGNENIVRILIDAGANVNVKDNNRDTALMIAESKGYANISRILIEAGATNYASGGYGESKEDESENESKSDESEDEEDEDEVYNYAVIMAAKYGEENTLRSLIINDNYDYDIRDKENGMSALMWAVRNDHHNIVKILIELEANLNLKDDEGYSALMLAIIYNKLNIASTLIDAGADVNIRNDNGWTALMIAVENREVEIVNTLIDAGADVNIRNDEGLTALQIAIKQDNRIIVRILQEAGAIDNSDDIEYSSEYDEREGATTYVSGYGNSESKSNEVDNEREGTTTYVSGYGNSESKSNEVEDHPLITAAKNGDQDTVWTLITEDNVDVDNIVDNEYGMNALMWAIHKRHFEIATDIISVGANVNLGDKNGETALMYAAGSGNKEIVELLLNNNADIELEDDQGSDAIAYARLYDNSEEILDLLRDHYAYYVYYRDNEREGEDSGEYYDGKYIEERRSPRRNRDGEIIHEY